MINLNQNRIIFADLLGRIKVFFSQKIESGIIHESPYSLVDKASASGAEDSGSSPDRGTKKPPTYPGGFY